MSVDGNKQREVDLMLAALRTRTDDPELDQLARYSILSSIVGDPVLESAATVEVGPEQAELDLHLGGPTIEGHSAKAEPFGIFVARTAEAVKEMSKAKLGRKAYSSDLLISATTPGSLRVVLKSPNRPDKGHTRLEDSSASNVESDSLRTLAILFAQAGEERTDDADAVSATIQQLPPAARERVRSAVWEVAKSGWTVDGELRQRGVGIVRIHLANDRATRLRDELAQTESTVQRDVKIVGKIDGTRRFTGTMWFQPDRAEKPFVASVTDARLLERVNELNALPDTSVRATFDKYDVYRRGADHSRARTTYMLTGIDAVQADSIELDMPGADG